MGLTSSVKHLLKHVAARVPVDMYQRFMAYSILTNEFKELADLASTPKRNGLWDIALERHIGTNAKITYVEFGVHEGYSIKYFASQNSNPDSVFIGLDSFEGLPEDWGPKAKGTFSVGGALPVTDDARISFIKGWFQNTWDELAQRISQAGTERLVVHYDADLYSSTLYALAKIDGLKQSYIAIFDEFPGHETRALYNYRQAFNAQVTFIGKTTNDEGFGPLQVLCRITPGQTHAVVDRPIARPDVVAEAS